jgi:glycosyltransferase involved in cell wall biosynthesis
MSAPFFSVVIPSRNRFETLKFSLLTVLKQGYGNFELIVSDNSDQGCLPDISFIKEELQDSRIKYFKPESVLSMSDNWEFAVSKATGEYIIVFGDDDGLVVDALENLYSIINKTKSEIVSWARVEYSWPDRKPDQYANLMVIPYMGKTGIMDSESYIKSVIHRKADYRYLPMFYNSAISSKLISILRVKTGRVFHSASPDIYSGYVFAHLNKKYISIGYPLSINGVSSKSNGAAHLNNDESVKEDYWTTFKTSAINWPESIPEINAIYLGIAEPFVQASQFFPELNKLISRKEIFRLIIDKLESSSEADLSNKKERILESARNDKSLYKWVSNYLDKIDPKFIPVIPGELESRVGFDGYHLILNAANFDLNNVYDVSVFIKNMFGTFKEADYSKPVSPPLLTRLKKAAGIFLRGI